MQNMRVVGPWRLQTTLGRKAWVMQSVASSKSLQAAPESHVRVMYESYESKVEAGRENLESQRGQERGHWHRERSLRGKQGQPKMAAIWAAVSKATEAGPLRPLEYAPCCCISQAAGRLLSFRLA